MLRLIRASLIKYFKSPLLILAVLCSLLLGMIHGVQAWRYIHSNFDFYSQTTWLGSPMSDLWFKCDTWVLIVLISLMIGREFSDGTIRNKLFIGHTKKAVYLSEMISAMVVTSFSFLVFIIPTIIGGSYYFFTIPTIAFILLLGELFLFFLVWSVFSVALTLLIANRAIGVVAVFSIMLFFAVVNVNLRGYYYNTAPAEIIETGIEFSDDGKPYSVERTIRNRCYLEGLPKSLVIIEHEIDSFSRLYNACNYAYLHHPEKAESDDFEIQHLINQQIQYDSLILLVTGGILAVGGLILFQKRDLK